VTRIQWVQNADGSQGKTWNPTQGCSRVSPGCDHCYAMHFEHRFSGAGQRSEGLTIYREGGGHPGVDWSGVVRLNPKKLAIPLRRKAPTTWFVNSTSDLFHPALTNQEIASVFGVMAATPQHTYQVLTKRADRLPEWFEWAGSAIGRDKTGARSRIECDPLTTCTIQASRRVHIPAGTPRPTWPLPNVWLGVSAENQEWADKRIPKLLEVEAAVRFVSAEPLLGAIDLSKVPGLNKGGQLGFDILRNFWVIVGGESGAGARPCNVRWIWHIVSQCAIPGVPVFVKQLGRFAYDDGGGREFVTDQSDGSRKGDAIHLWPEDLRVRQMPRIAA